jgi:hypothetical protein
MSISARLLTDLQEADEVIKDLEKKLPWYKRIGRRYMTGGAFVAWQISSVFTWVKAGFTAVFLFGKSNLTMALATKYPVAYNLCSAAWSKICIISLATAEVFHEAVI